MVIKKADEFVTVESTSACFMTVHLCYLCCDVLCLCTVLNVLLCISELVILFSIFHS